MVTRLLPFCAYVFPFALKKMFSFSFEKHYEKETKFSNPQIINPLYKVNLRFNDLPATHEDENVTDNFILVDSFVAVTADDNSMDTVVYTNISKVYH